MGYRVQYEWENEESETDISPFTLKLKIPIPSKLVEKALGMALKGLKIASGMKSKGLEIEKFPMHHEYLNKIGIEPQLKIIEKDIGVFITKYAVEDAYFTRAGSHYTADLLIKGMAGESSK